jgi:stage V sporulation protein G
VEVTEVRIKLMEEPGERLQAFCSITFDNCFVIRDLKIIEGTNGPFVAMPSRKLTSHCQHCGCKNHLRASYCNQCGTKQREDRAMKDDDGRAKLYADIAHPINSGCREMIQERVIKSFLEEIERSKLPGYVSTYDDFDDYEYAPKQTREQAHRPAPSPPHFDRKPVSAPAPNSTSHRGGPHRSPSTPPPSHSIPAPTPPQNRDQKTSGGKNFGQGIF